MNQEINRALHIIGAASGLGSKMGGTEEGPFALQSSPYLKQSAEKGLNLLWEEIVTAPVLPGQSKILTVANWCQKIALLTRALAQTKQFFLVFGGDNTCSIGTWSGVHGALYDQGPIGLIWVDAHLDSHTPETTESDCLNGMPLAALMGYGDPLFTRVVHPEPKLLPQHVCHIGARSYERGERELIQRLGVKTFFMEEVNQLGIEEVFQQALKIVKTGTIAYGICIDIDAIDPTEAPGVGNPEPGGLRTADLVRVLTKIRHDPNLIGFEIVELNPSVDQKHQTEKIACELIEAVALL